MRIRGRTAALVAAAAVVVVTGVGLTAWLLAHESHTWTSDRCADASYEFSVEEDDGEGLEVGYELQSTSPGETWSVLIERGGTPLLEGERRTDEDAELEVDVQVPRHGDDEFTATATPPGGEPCSTRLLHG